MKKYVLFRPHFCRSKSVLTRPSHSGQFFFCDGVHLFIKVSLSSFIPEIFEQNFSYLVTVYLREEKCGLAKMRTKKRIAFQGKANTYENGQKRTKNGYCLKPPLK